jgi:hypothetical protein
MEYKRTPLKTSEFNSSKPIDVKHVTRIWGMDGWSYIPQLKTRERFTETHFFSENWEGIISPHLYSEQLIRTMYSQSPLAWSEHGELYELTKPNHSK